MVAVQYRKRLWVLLNQIFTLVRDFDTLWLRAESTSGHVITAEEYFCIFVTWTWFIKSCDKFGLNWQKEVGLSRSSITLCFMLRNPPRRSHAVSSRVSPPSFQLSSIQTFLKQLSLFPSSQCKLATASTLVWSWYRYTTIFGFLRYQFLLWRYKIFSRSLAEVCSMWWILGRRDILN